MKNKTISLFITMISVALHTFHCTAQNHVFDYIPSEYSIVRSTDEEYTIIYSQTSTTSKFVIHAASDSRSFDLPPKLTVNDFEVGDSMNAWFCGDMGGIPTLGYFNIIDAYNGIGTMSLSLINGDSATGIKFKSFDRMDFLRIDNSRIVLAMVGSLYAISDIPTVLSAVYSACAFYANQWSVWYSYDSLQTVKYTDIAAIDSMFIAVGTDAMGQDCYIKTYQRAPDFVFHDCSPNNIFKLECQNAEGPALITKSGERKVSIAQHSLGKQSLLCHRIDFSRRCHLTSISTFEYSNAYPLPTAYDTSGMRLLELRHSNPEDCPYLLHRGYHSTSPASPFSISSWIIPLTPMSVTAHSIIGDTEHSLDLHPAAGTPFTSGFDNPSSALNMFSHNLTTANSCRHYTSLNIKLSSTDIIQIPYRTEKYDVRKQHSFFPIDIKRERATISCTK